MRICIDLPPAGQCLDIDRIYTRSPYAPTPILAFSPLYDTMVLFAKLFRFDYHNIFILFDN
jgi:hypothetical protein